MSRGSAMYRWLVTASLAAMWLMVGEFPTAAQEEKPKTGAIVGELKSLKDTADGKNTFIEVLAPGEEKPRRYHVLYDAKAKGPIESVLAAVRAAKVGDRVEFDWVQTGHGPAIAAFRVLKPGAVSGRGQPPKETAQTAHGAKADMPEAVFKNYKDLKWERIVPDLGANSPEVCILHVDPKTKATKLLIRMPKAIHVRKHWHSANETHTMIAGTAVFACDGKRIEQGPGSFNYLPAKMVHEAWPSEGSVVFITVDGPWDVNWVEGAPTSADLIK